MINRSNVHTHTHTHTHMYTKGSRASIRRYIYIMCVGRRCVRLSGSPRAHDLRAAAAAAAGAYYRNRIADRMSAAGEVSFSHVVHTL